MKEKHRASIYYDGRYIVRHEVSIDNGPFLYADGGTVFLIRADAEKKRDNMEKSFQDSGVLAEKSSLIHLIMNPAKRDRMY